MNPFKTLANFFRYNQNLKIIMVKVIKVYHRCRSLLLRGSYFVKSQRKRNSQLFHSMACSRSICCTQDKYVKSFHVNYTRDRKNKLLHHQTQNCHLDVHRFLGSLDWDTCYQNALCEKKKMERITFCSLNMA